jgi:spermidine synthase
VVSRRARVNRAAPAATGALERLADLGRWRVDRTGAAQDEAAVSPTLLLALFFASGAAGVAYELLWVRDLALVFGNTAQATATTLAVFFLGLSLGQHLAGRHAQRARNPLRAYAVLEASLALSAASYFALLPVSRAVVPALAVGLASDGWLATAARAALAAGLLVAPCACMGATLPLMGHLLVRRGERLAPRFGLLYAVQTVGGAAGALAAGFWLPFVIGFQRTYLMVMALSASIAAIAYLASRAPGSTAPAATAPAATAAAVDSGWERVALGVAALSGLAALAVEVLWTHMFSQALHNSVYSFAAILVTFLTALGLGGALAAVLACTARKHPLAPLAALLMASAVGVALSPFVFNWMTGGLRLYAGHGWAGHVRALFTCAAAVMLAPAIAMGSVFPYAVRLAERRGAAAAVIGRLASWNTVGAVAGSIAGGFALLPGLGLWSSLRLAGLLYAGACAVVLRAARAPLAWMAGPVLVAGLLLTLLAPSGLPQLSLAPGETLRDVRESASGTVAVTESDGVLALKLDGHYTVGASGAVADDRRQGELPILLHPRPRSVFYLGLGTGISAGAALFHPLEQVTVAELVPGIAELAREYFAPFANGLFTDPRVDLVIGDGRAVLRANPQPYDVVVGDLFVPWHAGSGSLYTREHFATVRDRLADDGVFAQWLPLYQLSWREFASIAHTMLDVFPLVTVWRGDFSVTTPIVALVGYRTPRPLDLDAVVANARARADGADSPAERTRALALLFYAGNLSAAHELVEDAPINTDDRPVIEYLAPETPLLVVDGRAQWLTGSALQDLWDRLGTRVPPAADPYLAEASPAEREDVEAGRLLHEAVLLGATGRGAAARAALDAWNRMVPASVVPLLPMLVGGR